MKIALVDDDGRFRAQMVRSLVDILDKHDVTAEIGKYALAAELLNALDGGERALAQLASTPAKKIVFKTESGMRSVELSELVWSETDEHYQHVHLADDSKFITRMSGQELWETLKDKICFFRAGLKYIINISQITRINKNEVTLKGTHVITVPRRTATELRDAYLAFCCQ